MSISFAALIAADVSFMRTFGLGLTLAVLADATLVRMVLMPAFMHALGEWNWWAPTWLARLHARVGLREIDAASNAVASNTDGLNADALNAVTLEHVMKKVEGECHECCRSRPR